MPDKSPNLLSAVTPKSTRERTTYRRRRQAAAAREGKIAKRAAQLVADLKTSTKEQLLEQWLRRPRLPTIFADILARSVEKIAKSLGWSDDRLMLVTQLVVEYREEPNIENYLRIRREVPEVEIEVQHFVERGFPALKHINQHGIEPDLVVAAWCGGAPFVDALSLRLLELRAARDQLPENGPGHIQRRREAINDATINYLVATMLEKLASAEGKCEIPASLVVLIRHQLCGMRPDLHTMCLAETKRNGIARAAAEKLKPGEKLSINKLARMTGLPRATAARFLKSGFAREIALFQPANYRSCTEINKHFKRTFFERLKS